MKKTLIILFVLIAASLLVSCGNTATEVKTPAIDSTCIAKKDTVKCDSIAKLKVDTASVKK